MGNSLLVQPVDPLGKSVNENPTLEDGAIIVIDVIANVLDAGFVTLTEKWVAPVELPVPTIT